VTHSRPPTPAQSPDTPTGSIDPVVAAITHELRTPLQAIIGFSQLALMDWPEGVDARYLTHIDQASRLMLRVVNDLLDLSHLENGTLAIDHDQALDLHALVLQVLDSGDGKRIEQVLLNLLANAIRFTDQGQVVVGARLVGQGEVTLRLSVADTGVGLDPHALARLNEPVATALSHCKPQRGGSGFGLSIVRRLLALHDTELKAASVQGGGTLMWFDLTLACDGAPAKAHTAPNPPDALVLTQNERLFHTVRTQWAAQGLTVSLAPSPEQAACAASRWVIDASLPQAPAWQARARALGCQAWLVHALPLAGDTAPASHLALPRLPQAVFKALNKKAATDPALQGMRVLVVEDNPLNQRVMRDQLGRMGVACGMAESGGAAKASLSEGGWDAALLDMQLPDISGLALAHWMRQQASCAKLPFLFLSAHLSAADRLAAEVLGARACLLKPHDPQALHKLLLEMRPAHLSPVGRQRTEAGLLALSALDTRQLMRSEWPTLRLGLQLAEDATSLRKAVHAVRGSLAILGHSPALAQARVLEEGLLAGVVPEPAILLAFMSSIEDMLSVSPPNPG